MKKRNKKIPIKNNSNNKNNSNKNIIIIIIAIIITSDNTVEQKPCFPITQLDERSNADSSILSTQPFGGM